MSEIVAWISLGINALVVAGFLVGRKWIETRVERSVQHKFDEQLEATKSELRTKEAEISSLREMVLTGSAQRQALLDSRRIVAVERVWAATSALAPLAMASASMARIDFEVAAKQTPTNTNARKLFDIIAPASHLDSLKKVSPAINEQPFLSPLAWAYFHAYQSIIVGAYLQARMLAEGVGEADKFIKREGAKELLKATLPHLAKFIDENDPSAYHYLLDELKERLLLELRKMLEGKDVDRAAVDQAKLINDLIRQLETEGTEQSIVAAKAGTGLLSGSALP